AVLISSVNVASLGFSVANFSANVVLEGMVLRTLAMAIWFSSLFRQATTSAALACRALLPVCGTVQTSPPSGATEVWPASRTGILTTPYCSEACLSREGICHGPLTIMAALPARNWSLTSACVQFRAGG